MKPKSNRMLIMEKILSCLWLLLLLGVVPLVIGLPWAHMTDGKTSYALAYGVGFFIQLALFQVAVTPEVFLHGSLIHVVWIYSVLLLSACTWSIWYIRKKHIFPSRIGAAKFSVFEIIYLCAFLAVLGVQIVRGFTYDLTYMSLDDATYTVIAEQALEGQGLGVVSADTGQAIVLDLKYGLPAWLYYPALLAFLSGLSVTTVAHTIQYVQLILLAYAVYWYLSGLLFENRQNRLIFMLFLALIYWYGHHSHYSLTFRLLGPNYQGKAVLAVSLTPLVLALLIKKLNEPYQWRFFWLLFLLSIAACSLTFWGAGTLIVVLALPILISLFFKGRDFKHLLYILGGSVIPANIAALFFIINYAT